MATQEDFSKENGNYIILRQNSDDIKATLCEPAEVAIILFSEELITESIFEQIEDEVRPDNQKRILLRAILALVRENSHALEKFASVLKRFVYSEKIGSKLLHEIGRNQDGEEELGCPVQETTDSLHSSSQQQNVTISQEVGRLSESSRKIFLKPTYCSEFNKIRTEFVKMKNSIKAKLHTNQMVTDDLEALKTLVSVTFPELKSSICVSDCPSEVLTILSEKCNVLDVTFLELIINYYAVDSLKQEISQYKEILEKFCDDLSLKICCGVEFTGCIPPGRSLKCDMVEFILDWQPDNHVLSDVRLLLEKAFEKMSRKVKVAYLDDGHSVLIGCFAHYCYHPILIMKAQKNLQALKDSGLKRLIIGYSIIWDEYTRDEEVSCLAKDLKDVKSILNEKIAFEKMSTNQCIENEKLRQKLAEETRGREVVERMYDDLKEHYKKDGIQHQLEKERLQKIIDNKTEESEEKDNESVLTESMKESVQHLQDVEITTCLQNPVVLQKYIAVFSEKQVNVARMIQFICETTDNGESDSKELSEIVKDQTHRQMIIQNFMKFIQVQGKGISWGSDGVRMIEATPSQCQSVMKFIAANKSLRMISLINFDFPSTTIVFESLPSTTISSLWIDHSSINFDSLCKALQQVQSTINHVTLWSCHLTTNALEHLATALNMETSVVHSLDLDGNSLSEAKVDTICRIIATNKSMKKLQLSNCDINDEGASKIFSALTENSSLKELILHRNPKITDDAVDAISNYLVSKHSNVTKLFLHQTSISVSGFKNIVCSLEKNETISKIFIADECQELIQDLPIYDTISTRVSFK